MHDSFFNIYHIFWQKNYYTYNRYIIHHNYWHMRSLFASIVAICTAIWIYFSIRYYHYAKNASFENDILNTNLEIIIMLIWAFIFGYIFWNILSWNSKKRYIKKSQLDKIKSSYTQSKKYWLYENNIDKIEQKKVENTSSTIVDNNDLKADFNQNSNVNIEWKESEKNVYKKSFFWNFLEDNDIEKDVEPDNNSSEKNIDTEAWSDMSTSKNVFFTEKKDESIMKMHQKNIQDDLTKIEWIWPKIAELLRTHDIFSFKDLAETDPFVLTDILSSAGTRFQMHNPKTWPKQAQYAYNNDWETLMKYQEQLKWWKE